MPHYEYKVVPAPRRGLKGKGVKGTDALFANALQAVMNEHGAQGWEYQRTDTLPCDERQGLTGRTTTFQNMLVFRRALAAEPDAGIPPEPPLAIAPPEAPAPHRVQTREVPPETRDAAASGDATFTDGDAPDLRPFPAPEPRIAESLTRPGAAPVVTELRAVRGRDGVTDAKPDRATDTTGTTSTMSNRTAD